MRVAILGGTGKLGYGLAKRLAHQGIPVMIGSRSKGKAEKRAEELNHMNVAVAVQGDVLPEAAIWGDIIFITVPYKAHHSTIGQIKQEASGKIVVDTTVPLVENNPTEQMDSVTAVAEDSAQLLGTETKLVAGFHTISHTVLTNLDADIESDVLLCGNNEEAIDIVSNLTKEIGGHPVHAGGLKNARVLERLTPMVISMNKRYKKKHIGIKVSGL